MALSKLQLTNGGEGCVASAGAVFNLAFYRTSNGHELVMIIHTGLIQIGYLLDLEIKICLVIYDSVVSHTWIVSL